MPKILRVFNNNVVLAKDGAREVIIVTGRGLGFQAKPGQRVDDAKIVRVFVPADGRDPDHIAELLSEIPPEIIRLVTDAMTATGLAEQAESQPTLVMALADHITGAVQRAQRHVNIEYPLQAEVQSLYASEYAQASRLVNELNRHLNGVLPGSEAVAFALHLVNAGFCERRPVRHIQDDRHHPADDRRHRRQRTASRLRRTASMSAGSSRICVTCSYASIRA